MSTESERMRDRAVGIERAKSGAHPVRYRDGVRRPRWSGYTAFVLSGGGARGSLQVGMLRALLEHGERPDVVVGTSIGAWNGAWLARTPTLDGVRQLERVWRGLTSMRVLLGRETHNGNPPNVAVSALLMLAAVQRVTQGYPSLYGYDGGVQLLKELYGDQRFEDLELPLRVVATDLTAGARAVFGSGSLMEAILASSAIPGIFPPQRIGKHVYVDGGTLENASLDVAVDLGARRLFVLDVGYDVHGEAGHPWPGDLALSPGKSRNGGPHPLAAVLERASQVMSQRQLDQAIAHLPPGIEIHLIRPTTPTGGTLDFGRAAEWIEVGYTLTRDYLQGVLPAPDEEAEPPAEIGERLTSSSVAELSPAPVASRLG